MVRCRSECGQAKDREQEDDPLKQAGHCDSPQLYDVQDADSTNGRSGVRVPIRGGRHCLGSPSDLSVEGLRDLRPQDGFAVGRGQSGSTSGFSTAHGTQSRSFLGHRTTCAREESCRVATPKTARRRPQVHSAWTGHTSYSNSWKTVHGADARRRPGLWTRTIVMFATAGPRPLHRHPMLQSRVLEPVHEILMRAGSGDTLSLCPFPAGWHRSLKRVLTGHKASISGPAVSRHAV